MNRIPILPVIALAFAISGVPTTQVFAETEPNNKFGDEDPIIINSSMTGDSVDGSSDYFKIENTGGFTSIKIDFTPTFENPGDDQLEFRILDGGFEDVHREDLGSESAPVSRTITASTETFSTIPINMDSFIIVIDPEQVPVGTYSYRIDVSGTGGAADRAKLAKISRLKRQISKTKSKIRKAKKKGARGRAAARRLKKTLKKQKKRLSQLRRSS